MKTKYFSKKITINGITYDSKAESRRHGELRLNPDINELESQKKFVLLDKFKDKQGKTERAITYKCDFFYFDNSVQSYVVEDVKSSYTAKIKDYIIKRKMFKSRYPQYVFREVIR